MWTIYKKQRKNTKTKNSRYIYQKQELHKARFQHDVAYGDFKDLTRRTAFDNMLRGEGFNNDFTIQSMMDIKGVLLRWL